jgi:hypothetical protein
VGAQCDRASVGNQAHLLPRFRTII